MSTATQTAADTATGADTGVRTITRDDYKRLRPWQYAGPISSLLPEWRDEFARTGATHWVLTNERGATVLAPARVEDEQ
ncbi:hypothetical protein [Actinophytocola sp.]|uniref:hypothetical protein n=1 Tax=Actinophytocola sp. TaxID=1872138 RepID=UPI002D6ED343|nr:hypothetical protein [Actinophytocola sp.]HYQ62548.1 hypothetical protein [Actinophytocola sp.]